MSCDSKQSVEHEQHSRKRIKLRQEPTAPLRNGASTNPVLVSECFLCVQFIPLEMLLSGRLGSEFLAAASWIASFAAPTNADEFRALQRSKHLQRNRLPAKLCKALLAPRKTPIVSGPKRPSFAVFFVLEGKDVHMRLEFRFVFGAGNRNGVTCLESGKSYPRF